MAAGRPPSVHGEPLDDSVDALGVGVGVGLGLVTMSRKYRRDRDIYDQGRVALAPQLGRGLAGVALTGRF